MPENLEDIWQAFILARDSLYPTITNNNALSLRKASDYLNGELSAMEIMVKANEKIFRKNANKKVYTQDLDLFKTISKVKDIFVKKQAIFETKGIKGDDVIAVIPKKAFKLKKSEVDQNYIATMMILTDPFVEEWVKQYKNLTNAKK
jgi:hypothetical protein